MADSSKEGSEETSEKMNWISKIGESWKETKALTPSLASWPSPKSSVAIIFIFKI
jgi:hypothetical protein